MTITTPLLAIAVVVNYTIKKPLLALLVLRDPLVHLYFLLRIRWNVWFLCIVLFARFVTSLVIKPWIANNIWIAFIKAGFHPPSFMPCLLPLALSLHPSHRTRTWALVLLIKSLLILVLYTPQVLIVAQIISMWVMVKVCLFYTLVLLFSTLTLSIYFA